MIEAQGSATALTTPVTKEVSTGKKLDQLYSLIDGIETAMMTTRANDGALVSRPMQVQARDAGTDLWFMAPVGSDTVHALTFDAHVNLAFTRNATQEWVSVSGIARVTTNRARIKALYKDTWKAWLPAEGGDHDGGPGDPRIALIEVEAQLATFMKSEQPGIVLLSILARAKLTGAMPDLGVVGTLNSAALSEGEAREPKA